MKAQPLGSATPQDGVTRLYRWLCDVAAAGLRLPDNGLIAAAMGRTESWPTKTFRTLEKRGLIRVEAEGGGPDCWRVVTITATGQSTMANPREREARAARARRGHRERQASGREWPVDQGISKSEAERRAAMPRAERAACPFCAARVEAGRACGCAGSRRRGGLEIYNAGWSGAAPKNTRAAIG